MKSLIQAVVVAAALAAPVAAFAQANQGLTRAQVRAELVKVEKAGYNPARGEDPYYPADIQAAEGRVAAQNAKAPAVQASVADTSGAGGMVSGSSASGAPAAVRPAANDGMKPLYFGH
ncbi:DUF4148 domain-containing protein [Paraburkholderia panacisoli]|uniref:DUF4148 domain-containing protein n=1 Tax=Paraburkholderia panacisoli TaxID=2603818 RepID=A0A5B0GJ06_9BURK|nr:DUF4148 domain-containing protein [Paraburkholderia panacisoli]KAA1003394.1 DUF4148 domain-containing protein [Paraburkholderia panacisoli]